MSVSRGGQFIGYTLLQTSAISSVVSSRIYEGLRPKASALSSLPTINFYEIAGGGRDRGLHNEVYSINCRASTINSTKTIAELVVDLFGGISGTGICGISDGFNVARAFVIKEGGIIPETESNCFNCPIDVHIIF